MSSVVLQTRKNFGQLVSGQAAGAVLALIALYLMASRLSPADFGIVVLLQTYVVSVRELVNFKLFEAVVRYGVPKLDSGDHGALRRLLRYTFKVDVISSLLAALAAVAGAGAAGALIGWQPAHTPLAVGFSLVLVLSAVGTSRGLLRLFGRFDVLGGIGVLACAIRLVGVIVAIQMQAGVAGFVVAWAVSLLAEYALTNYYGWREAHRRLPRPLQAKPGPPFRQEFPGWWPFVNVVYWQGNLDLLPKHIATLLAGNMLGPAGAGLFRIARELSEGLSKPAQMLRNAVFPDLTRLWQRRDRDFVTLCWRPVLWVGPPAMVAVVVALIWGEAGIRALLGADYVPVAPLLVILLGAASLELLSASLRPAGYATNQATLMLWIQVASVVLYLPAFVVFTAGFGLIGPGIAALVATLAKTSGMGAVVWRKVRQLGR